MLHEDTQYFAMQSALIRTVGASMVLEDAQLGRSAGRWVSHDFAAYAVWNLDATPNI